MGLKKLFLGITFVGQIVQASGFGSFQGTSFVWNNNNALPQAEIWQPFYDESSDIAADLNSGGGKYRLEYKAKGGSSHQVLVIRNSDNQVLGLWTAANHATWLAGEVFGFHLSRLLGRSHLVSPGVRMTLTGPGRIAAMKALNSTSPVGAAGKTKTPAARACNQVHMLTYMQANENYITGVYKGFSTTERPIDIPELVDRKNGKRLELEHFLVKAIRAQAAQPDNTPVYLKKDGTLSMDSANAVSSSTASNLAKELSFMTLIDALNSQRDRFGIYGSNMQAYYNSGDKSFRIAAIDNGGISDSAITLSLRFFLGGAYQEGHNGVERFEKDVMQDIINLDDFIKGKIGSFKPSQSSITYTDINQLKYALGFEDFQETTGAIGALSAPCKSTDNWMYLFAPWATQYNNRLKAFATALDLVAKKMRALRQNPGSTFID